MGQAVVIAVAQRQNGSLRTGAVSVIVVNCGTAVTGGAITATFSRWLQCVAVIARPRVATGRVEAPGWRVTVGGARPGDPRSR